MNCTYIHPYIYVLVCVCVCAQEREKRKEIIWSSSPKKVSYNRKYSAYSW